MRRKLAPGWFVVPFALSSAIIVFALMRAGKTAHAVITVVPRLQGTVPSGWSVARATGSPSTGSNRAAKGADGYEKSNKIFSPRLLGCGMLGPHTDGHSRVGARFVNHPVDTKDPRHSSGGFQQSRCSDSDVDPNSCSVPRSHGHREGDATGPQFTIGDQAGEGHGSRST